MEKHAEQSKKLVTIYFPQMIVKSKKVILAESEIEDFQKMSSSEKAEFIGKRLSLQEQKQLVDFENYIEYYDSLIVKDDYGLESFKAVVIHPKKGEQHSGYHKSLNEAKKWASYMIYMYECVPVLFENEITGEIFPPTNIPKY